jgi:3,4-dihydroxy 2-butanone 4-phosphate synthase/GTP cyclohydrolase II
VNKIEELIADVRSGRMVVLIDDEDRENEGDLVLAADLVTPEAINFMVKEARGLVCLSLTHDQIERLQIPQMVSEDANLSPNKTAFTVSIEASKGISTGISAADRAHTIRVASRIDAKPSDVIAPGHVFPIRAKAGGVLKRAGHTEGSIDLCKLAGLSPAAVICEVMNDDGTMARVGDLREFAKKHGLKIGTIVDLIRYRLEHESLVEEVAQAKLPNRFGEDFKVRAFRSLLDGTEHLVMQLGDITKGEPCMVRVHSECMTGDVFGSTRCDCGPQLHKAMEMISNEGRGVILYLRQEGRGIGLVNKIRAYALQDKGLDTVEANVHLGFPPDARDYGIGAQILRAIGLGKIRLLTNNPSKRVGLGAYGIEVVGRVPLVVETHANNAAYMKVKKEKMGHVYTAVED